jgi:hypothetical protein
MSLDVYLESDKPVVRTLGTGIFVRDNGQTRELTADEVHEKYPNAVIDTAGDYETGELYSANITHNLNRMAGAAGIYEALWRPDEIGITTASQLIPLLCDGLQKLVADPARFKALNPENGWGDYDGLVKFVTDYLVACLSYPNAIVRVSR